MYILHPDKHRAIENILARKRARQGVARPTAPRPATEPPRNLVLALAQKLYAERGGRAA